MRQLSPPREAILRSHLRAAESTPRHHHRFTDRTMMMLATYVALLAIGVTVGAGVAKAAGTADSLPWEIISGGGAAAIVVLVVVLFLRHLDKQNQGMASERASVAAGRAEERAAFTTSIKVMSDATGVLADKFVSRVDMLAERHQTSMETVQATMREIAADMRDGRETALRQLELRLSEISNRMPR